MLHCRNYFKLRCEQGVADELCLKGFKLQQCDRLQNDGWNCGVITLKVSIAKQYHIVSIYYYQHGYMGIGIATYM